MLDTLELDMLKKAWDIGGEGRAIDVLESAVKPEVLLRGQLVVPGQQVKKPARGQL